MTKTRGLASWVALLILAFFTLQMSMFAQATRTPSPGGVAYLRRSKLISPGTGWTIVDQPSDRAVQGENCTNAHLYWTENNGKDWRDITPPDMPTRNIGQVFFLDRSHGWMLSTDALSEETYARFYLLSTEDGGKNWRTLVLQRPAFKLMDDYTFPSQLFFSDSQHGWILWHWHMMNKSLDALLATTDGGRTWSRLPDPPGPGPLQFTSPHDGWIIGGPEIPDGIPDPESENLWATHDGGIHWHVVSVPLPADSEAGEAYFSAFRFKNSREGLAVAERQLSGRLFRFLTCVTRDGGRSWKVSHFDAYHASPSFVGEHIIWSLSDWPAMKVTFQIDDHVTSPILPAGTSLEGGLGDVDFIDDSNGWTTYRNGRTTLVFMSGPKFAPMELLSTTDGGKTFQIITPPVAAQTPFPPPELFVVNGIVIRYPKRPPGFALPPPSDVPTGGRRIRFGPYAGGPMTINGTGFLPENTVWFGTRPTQAASKDGEHLLLLVPADVPPGNYDVYIENAHGKTEPVKVPVRPSETLRIAGIQNRDIRFRGESGIHPGQQVSVTGSGFLLENTVCFGTQAVPAQLVVSGGAGLHLDVPASLAPGTYEIYVMNANGRSNTISVIIE
jgi:photosystem II stability/assembly factor-like uncharacterized protein